MIQICFTLHFIWFAILLSLCTIVAQLKQLCSHRWRMWNCWRNKQNLTAKIVMKMDRFASWPLEALLLGTNAVWKMRACVFWKSFVFKTCVWWLFTFCCLMQWGLSKHAVSKERLSVLSQLPCKFCCLFGAAETTKKSGASFHHQWNECNLVTTWSICVSPIGFDLTNSCLVGRHTHKLACIQNFCCKANPKSCNCNAHSLHLWKMDDVNVNQNEQKSDFFQCENSDCVEEKLRSFATTTLIHCIFRRWMSMSTRTNKNSDCVEEKLALSNNWAAIAFCWQICMCKTKQHDNVLMTVDHTLNPCSFFNQFWFCCGLVIVSIATATPMLSKRTPCCFIQENPSCQGPKSRWLAPGQTEWKKLVSTSWICCGPKDVFFHLMQWLSCEMSWDNWICIVQQMRTASFDPNGCLWWSSDNSGAWRSDFRIVFLIKQGCKDNFFWLTAIVSSWSQVSGAALLQIWTGWLHNMCPFVFLLFFNMSAISQFKGCTLWSACVSHSPQQKFTNEVQQFIWNHVFKNPKWDHDNLFAQSLLDLMRTKSASHVEQAKVSEEEKCLNSF